MTNFQQAGACYPFDCCRVLLSLITLIQILKDRTFARLVTLSSTNVPIDPVHLWEFLWFPSNALETCGGPTAEEDTAGMLLSPRALPGFEFALVALACFDQDGDGFPDTCVVARLFFERKDEVNNLKINDTDGLFAQWSLDDTSYIVSFRALPFLPLPREACRGHQKRHFCATGYQMATLKFGAARPTFQDHCLEGRAPVRYSASTRMCLIASYCRATVILTKRRF